MTLRKRADFGNALGRGVRRRGRMGRSTPISTGLGGRLAPPWRPRNPYLHGRGPGTTGLGNPRARGGGSETRRLRSRSGPTRPPRDQRRLASKPADSLSEGSRSDPTVGGPTLRMVPSLNGGSPTEPHRSELLDASPMKVVGGSVWRGRQSPFAEGGVLQRGRRCRSSNPRPGTGQRLHCPVPDWLENLTSRPLSYRRTQIGGRQILRSGSHETVLATGPSAYSAWKRTVPGASGGPSRRSVEPRRTSRTAAPRYWTSVD